MPGTSSDDFKRLIESRFDALEDRHDTLELRQLADVSALHTKVDTLRRDVGEDLKPIRERQTQAMTFLGLIAAVAGGLGTKVLEWFTGAPPHH